MKALTRDEVRAVDRRAAEVYGIPTLVLMENAGAGLARSVARFLGERGRVVVVCGKGGNGGDGLVLARHLALAGHSVVVALAAEAAAFDRKSDCGANLTVAERMKLPIETCKEGPALAELLARTRPDIVADALLGTGLVDAVKAPLRGLIEAMNASKLPIVAVDLPSGLDCDTGKPLGVCVRAAFTVTFAAPKIGFEHGREWTGPVEVVALGCPTGK